jgi:hydroxypyruvate reductase
MAGGTVLSASPTKPAYETGKDLARRIFAQVLSAIDVRRAMEEKIRKRERALVVGDETVSLRKRPCVVAFGKAANRMAAVISEILAGEVQSGVVISPSEPSQKIEKFRYFRGGHPYPTAGSFAGAAAALTLVKGLREDDLVIYLVSGGGSALLEKPIDPGISLQDMEHFNRVLVGAGVPIEEMNVIRKHLSAVKGGRLAIQAHPAAQLTVYITDVPEQLPSMVSSGPTLPDESTVEQAYDLLKHYDLTGKLPASIRRLIEDLRLAETPKPDDERFGNSKFVCLLSNRDAVEAARRAAEKLGFLAEIDSGEWDIDYREVGEALGDRLAGLSARHPGKPVCLVVGGEVTCPVTGAGTGGRNQAFVLHLTPKIAGHPWVVLSAGTDGKDGNSPASGAVADGNSLPRAQARGLDAAAHQAASDSYHYFLSLGDVLETGYTDNNVRDVRLLLAFTNENSTPPAV